MCGAWLKRTCAARANPYTRCHGISIPFSDPMMDGPVIQQASRLALEAGATFEGILAEVRAAALDVPVVAMTYLNPLLAMGFGRFIEAASGVLSGAVVPDLPVDEAEPWLAAAPPAFATVFLAAPGTSKARLAEVAEASRGFVYCVSTFGVTGERSSLAATARTLVEELRPLTDMPLLVGVGVGTPEAAAEFVQRQMNEAGANYFVGQFAFGDLTLEETLRSVGLFAGEVMPMLARAPARVASA